MSNGRKWFLCGISFCLLCICRVTPMRGASALVKVTTNQELRQVMAQEGVERVELQADLSIDGPVTIRGEKQIDGRGHCLVRSTKKGKIYGGSLFVLQSGRCEWKDVTISGGGKKKAVLGKVFGRLIEVRQGTLVLGKGCVLCDNINDRLAVDGGGALRIASGGNCVLKGGTIKGNQTRSKGAGVDVEKGGCFTMLGGSIQNNKVEGAGDIEGFDGRGGAIYSRGRLVIKGGLVKGNTAKAYVINGIRYGGAGSAVYAEAGSGMDISGGVLKDNRDDRGCPVWMCGKLSLSGKPVLERIHLGRAVVICSKNSFRPMSSVTIEPEKYKSGICIAEGKKAPFQLVEEKGYSLERKGTKTYIVKTEKRKKVPDTYLPERSKRKKSGQKKKRGREGKKEKICPIIQCKRSEFLFYVGEKVNPDVLLTDVSASDPEEGNLTKKIRILKPEKLCTDRIKKGEVIYEVENHKGIRTRKKVSYRIQENHPPIVRTAPRFLFLREVDTCTKQQWRELLLEGCAFQDDCESRQELEDATIVEYPEIQNLRAGYQEITLTVQDQSGHRFYMQKGEKKRYGTGKKVTVKIPVTLIDYSELGMEDTGYMRFAEPDIHQRLEEEWIFSSDEIRDIQRFMDARADPFSAETNQEFLRLYTKCRRCEEDGKYE